MARRSAWLFVAATLLAIHTVARIISVFVGRAPSVPRLSFPAEERFYIIQREKDVTVGERLS